MALTTRMLEQIRERNARQLAEQGLTERIDDPAVLAQVARLVTRSTGRSASRSVRPGVAVVGHRGNLSGDAA